MSASLATAAHHARNAMRPGMRPGMPWALPDDAVPAAGAVMRIGADRPVYEQGDDARYFYKVVSGVVRTCQFLSDGRRQIDAFHLPGDVFGFEAGAEHRLSAEAVGDSTVVAFRRRGMESVIAGDDRIAGTFFAHAMACLEHAREHCLLLGRGTAAQKIAAFLLEMAERGGCETVVELAMSRQDIADYLGMTIETVSRTLSHMEREGTIALPSTRRVVLKCRRTLRALND